MVEGPPGFRTHTSEGKQYPRRMSEMLGRAYLLYAKNGAEKAFPHVLRGIDSAERHRVLEFDKIEDPKGNDDPDDLNQKLATTLALHPFKAERAVCRDFPAEDFAKYLHVVEGHNTFNALRENDLGRQDPDIYGKLLNIRSDGRPSLALPARMVDLVQYGRDGSVSEGEFSGLDPSKFYVFDSQRGRTEYELIGMAAKNVYSPLADMLGYRALAGDLFEIYYYNVDRSTHDAVTGALSILQERIALSQHVMGAVVAQLRDALDREGYRYKIKVRERKHPGKVMEKADRYSRHTWQSIQAVVEELHDLVAFTVVLDSKDGKLVRPNDFAHYERVAGMIVAITGGLQQLRAGLRPDKMFTDMVREPKDNGYQSFHIDMAFEDPSYVGLESIVRNRQMEDFAENGGAAHFLYKGSPQMREVYTRLVSKIGRAALPLTRSDTGPQRTISLYIAGELSPRKVVVPERACVGEALICADVDLTGGLSLSPKVSLLQPISGIRVLYVDARGARAQQLSRSMIDILIGRAVYEHTIEKLLGYRRNAPY